MEPETNTLTPDVSVKKKGNGPLYIIFGFLLVAIITLVIVIVVVNVNNNQVAKVEPAEPSDEDIIITNPEGYKQGQEFQALLSSISDESRKLLDESTDNADKVKEIFAEAINKYQDPEPVGFVVSLIKREVEILLSYNLKEKAYEVYNLTGDYLPKNPASQNDIYLEALKLAQEDNNQQWIDVFQKGFDATNAAKQADIDAIKHAKNTYDERVRQMIAEDNRKAAEQKKNNNTQTEQE